MRIWSVHPELLDTRGLVAAWREGLLAQACLLRGEGGYANHSQLLRFKAHEAPLEAICSVLWDIAEEAGRRGYNFNTDKIHEHTIEKVVVTTDQLDYELDHLYIKLCRRDMYQADKLAEMRDQLEPEELAGPSFEVVDGPIAEWEKINT